MNFRYPTLVLSILTIFLCMCLVSHAEENDLKFKLKPGANGKLCLGCHTAFKEKLTKPAIHTPLKKGQCTGCHNPHSASHGKLLVADAGNICSTCHKSVVPANAQSVHKVVAEGSCTKCHDPHSANSKFNLLKGGNDLCFGCHKEMGESVAKVKFKHSPLVKGCLTCHDPHASNKAAFLLKSDVPALCIGCHKTDRPNFIKSHMNYPVAASRCTSCHDPHGSDRAGILYNNVHKPVVSRMCNQCHEEATSATPLKTKKSGYELCRGCHSTQVNSMFAKNMVHWPILSKEGCLSCHNPHASKHNGLMKGDLITTCGRCHHDTIRRQEKSQTKHEPIKDGKCVVCHDPHASDNPYMFKKATIIDQCATCHDWQKHSTHPLGEKVRDPRNKNVSVQCLSCHRSHGTEYKHFIPFPSTSELCVQCHEQFKR
ncbi:MAG: cytochrome C [Geobacter sp.]|nr:MAG: cytochrome C [Geobacter sp.]